MIDTAIPLSEYQARRKKLASKLKGAVGLVMAGDGHTPLRGAYEADANFYYLTGIRGEIGAMLLLDPGNPNPKHREVLLLKPVDSEADQWDGYRELISKGLREKTGFDKVIRTTYLPRFLTLAAQRTKRLACLHPFASYAAPVSPDLALFRKVAERIPGCAIEDLSTTLAEMRAVKSANEQKVMRRAISATAKGYEAALGAIRPGASERDVHLALVRGFEGEGSLRPAYDPIVGSGERATILHYKENTQPIEDGDLIVIDAGAEVDGYASDITRTFPASGKFTAEQKEIYNVVLRAQKAAIDKCRVGATMWDVEEASRRVIENAGYGDYYPHGVGHHLGLETHDADPHQPLKSGHIVTIEPGVYIREKKVGVRIEDDILITPKGPKNLSSMIPKTVADVEKAMAAARKR